ncbi:hypothetical protein D3C79_630460 [compost metagenome]
MLIVLARKRLHAFLRQQLRLHQQGVEAISWLFQLRNPLIEQGERRRDSLLAVALGDLLGQPRLATARTAALGRLQPAAALGGEKRRAVAEGEFPQGRQALQKSPELFGDCLRHRPEAELLGHLGREPVPLEPVGRQGQTLLDALPEPLIRGVHGSAVLVHHVRRHGRQRGFIARPAHGDRRDPGPDGVTAQPIAHRRLGLTLDQELRHLELGLTPGAIVGTVDVDGGTAAIAAEHHGAGTTGGRRYRGR